MSNRDNAVTLKEWAGIVIAKHSRRMLKYEAGVIQDKDPEDLHQMRVGMRRLRSAISGFAIALDLPKTVNERNIAKIGRSLGKLRDLDVLLAALDHDYRPLLPKAEKKSLDKVIKSLHKHRKKEYVLRAVLEKVLKAAIAEPMPELANLFNKTRYQKWQEWVILQEEFLENKNRQQLRQTIQQPILATED